ncbi:MAG: MFS transporter [Candidatus Cryptobacteroides sp.]
MNRNNSGKLTWTVLSISLLTVMAGAAIAPALGIIRDHFADAPDMLVQLIVSLPALLIIVTNLLFPRLCSLMKTRTLAIAGLLMYVAAGAGCFFVDSIGLLLVLRALLGVSVGMIMPLSTGLLSYYFPPEKQAGLMGLSAAMNQMGGVVATLLAGLLADIAWNYAFMVYLLGMIAVVSVLLYLPNERLESTSGPSLRLMKKFHPSVVGMFLIMILFFIYPTRFALSAHAGTDLSNNAITLIMVGLDVVAFLIGLVFGKMMQGFRHGMKYLPPIGFIAGYLLLSMGSSLPLLLAGSAFIGIANGIGVPYLNTIASMKAGKEAASTVMPLLSAALYLGQFLSPLIVTPLGCLCFGSDDLSAPFKAGVIIGLIYLVQAWATRNKQVVG